jgi:SAM-dependent methyltransferase
MKLHYDYPRNILDNFSTGMAREVNEFIPVPWVTDSEGYDERKSVVVDLGAGNKHIGGATPLDAERGWWAHQAMPFNSESVDAFLAYHFMEHLTKAEIITVLAEVQRCLKPGGVFNVVVPHFSSEAAHQDLDHKSFWTESTWKNLFKNPYYDGTMPRSWKLREHQTLIMGLVQRNLVVVSQLVKAES